jgi:flagellar biogenesis protein FliO
MELLQPFLAVVLVLALLAGSLYLLKRRGLALFGAGLWTPPGPRRLELLDRLPLGPHHALHLVRVDSRKFLITTGPGSCQIAPEGGLESA